MDRTPCLLRQAGNLRFADEDVVFDEVLPEYPGLVSSNRHTLIISQQQIVVL